MGGVPSYDFVLTLYVPLAIVEMANTLEDSGEPQKPFFLFLLPSSAQAQAQAGLSWL